MKNFDSIEEALNVDTEVVETDIKPRKNQLEKTDKNDSDKDYEYSRAQLYSLVEKGQEAVNGILELAQESDSARAYEVAATSYALAESDSCANSKIPFTASCPFSTREYN